MSRDYEVPSSPYWCSAPTETKITAFMREDGAVCFQMVSESPGFTSTSATFELTREQAGELLRTLAEAITKAHDFTASERDDLHVKVNHLRRGREGCSKHRPHARGNCRECWAHLTGIYSDQPIPMDKGE